MPTLTRQIDSEKDLRALAGELAKNIRPGDLFTLDGPLGSGKTTFVQAICRALKVTEAVNSPSFGLINEYISGKIQVAHVDLYRLGSEKAHQIWDELYPYLDEGRHIVLIEWACYGENLPLNLYEEATIQVKIDYVPENASARMLNLTDNVKSST